MLSDIKTSFAFDDITFLIFYIPVTWDHPNKSEAQSLSLKAVYLFVISSKQYRKVTLIRWTFCFQSDISAVLLKFH